MSGPRAADGRLYDLAPFLLGDPTLWPRLGPTHAQHQVLSAGLVHFVKFANKQAYETWAVDDDWIYHLEDASGDVYHFTDPRWFPRRLAIGEASAFVTGPHEIVHTDRSTCQITRRDPVDRKMWLHALYDCWEWGRDLGQRPTVILAYDATAGVHAPDRYVELYYLAYGAGWCRWEAYHSDQVYAGGAAAFPDAARSARSDFYLVGGAAILPDLTGCVPEVCPHSPPLIPASQGADVVIDPKTVVVYASLKPSARPGCTNLILPDGSVFSCQADGSPGTRPAGTDGPWEQAQVTGSLATFNAVHQSQNAYYVFGIAPADKLDRA